MIRLDRKGVKTPADWKVRVEAALPDAAAFWKKARAFEKLVEHGTRRKKGFAAYAPDTLVDVRGKREFPPVWQEHDELREKIAVMSDRRCAYCQSNVSSNHPGKGGKSKPPGPIEHFKPKSRFPTQAYAVANYFLACSGCNVAKGSRWPVSGYVRPDRGEPGKRFVFGEDGAMKAARSGDTQAANTITDLDLNRECLADHRKNAIEAHLRFVNVHLQFATKFLDVSSLKVEALFVPEHTLFSEAINQNVRRVWAKARAQHP